MSGKFSMDDYVDVAERIAMFTEKYPEGTLQSSLEPLTKEGVLVGWLCKARAYRSADDPRPGIGHAVEPVPGKTPYTKDSEAMNAETSAWGRAIIACGFPTKKIASANEVRNRQDANAPAQGVAPPVPGNPASKAQLDTIEALIVTLASLKPDADAASVRKALESDAGPLAGLSEEAATTLLAKMQRWEKNLKASAGEQAAAGTDGPDVDGKPKEPSASAPAEESLFKAPTVPRGAKARAKEAA